MSLFQSLLASDGYDADYQAILDRGIALGYTLPSSVQRSKQNRFVVDLKAFGIWTALDILYVFATDGNSDYATLNWKSPTLFQIAKVNFPTFTSNQGFNGNGSTSYLNTSWRPSGDGINFTQNNASVGGYMFSFADTTSSTWGCSTNADGITNSPALLVSNVLATSHRLNDSITSTFVNSAPGLYHQRRSASNSKKMFEDGVEVQTSTNASVSVSTTAMYICASNGNGTATRFSNDKIGMFFAGSALTGNEANLQTAWNTYFTSL